MKWYLYPQGHEFTNWNRHKIQEKLPENVALQAQPPQAALVFPEFRLLPLTDAGPDHDENEVVDTRIVAVDLQENTAEVEYTYRNKTQQEISDELAAWRAATQVSRFQARAALQAAGLLSTVASAINSYDGPNAALIKLAWDEAVTWKRNSPSIEALAAILEISDTELDTLFETAQGIVA